MIKIPTTVPEGFPICFSINGIESTRENQVKLEIVDRYKFIRTLV